MNNNELTKIEMGFSLIARYSDMLCSGSNIEKVLSEICADLGALTESNRAVIYENINNNQSFIVHCKMRGSWSAENTVPFEPQFPFSWMKASTEELALADRIAGFFKKRRAVQLTSNEFPHSLGSGIAAHTLKSACLMPIFIDASLWGEIVLTSDIPEKRWDEIDFAILKSLAEILPSRVIRFQKDLNNQEAWIEKEILFENRIAGNILHRNDRIIRISKTALELLGGTEEDYLGKNFIDTLVHPASREIILARRANMKTQHSTLNPIEAVLQKKNGSALDVLITATWQKIGNDILINSTFFDISAIKSRERLMKAVSTIASSATSQVSLNQVMGILLSAIQNAFPYAECAGYVHITESLDEPDTLSGKLMASCELEPDLEQFIWQTVQSDACNQHSAFLMRGPSHSGIDTYLFQPVHSENHLLGAIFLQYQRNEAPHADEQTHLQTLAEAIVNAVQKIFLIQQNESRYKNLAVLYKASIRLGKLHSLTEIAREALQILEQEKGWTHSVIRIKDEVSKRLVTLSYCAPGIQSSEEQKVLEWLNTKISKPGDGLTGWVIEHGESVLCQDLPHDPRYLETDINMRYGIYAPIHAEGITKGSIGVESESINFSQADLELLCSLGDLIGMALNAIRTMELLSCRVRWLEQLYQAGNAVTIEASEDMIYEQLLDGAMDALSAETGAMMLFNAEKNLLIPVAKRGWLKDVVDPIAPDKSLSGLVFSSGRSHISWELNQDPAILSHIRKNIPDDKRGVSVPILAESTVIGVFHLAFSTDVHINKEIIAVAELFASFAGMVIKRAELNIELLNANNALRDAYDATLEGWSRAIGLRDDETASHGERVTSLAVAIGKQMDLSPEMMEALRRGALLHDIGKIGIPDRILLKQGALSDDERAIMQTHPVLAYQLLKPITFLKEAVTIPYCHHERWDGSGYPQGLRGEAVPLLARIFAIADVYDAMTSDRPYRKALSHDEAVAYIMSNSGKHFDPKVIRAFLALSRSLR